MERKIYAQSTGEGTQPAGAEAVDEKPKQPARKAARPRNKAAKPANKAAGADE